MQMMEQCVIVNYYQQDRCIDFVQNARKDFVRSMRT